MAIKVVKPGLATTVQDLGRPGYYHIGIPISGGMDRFALRCANLLVGNPEDAAVLEAAFLGPELEFTADATVAVTGAELPPKLDGSERPTWTSFAVRKGQTLSFGFLKSGARAYIAISGGVDVPVVWGRARPTRSARWAATRAASSKPATNCRSAPRRAPLRVARAGAASPWSRFARASAHDAGSLLASDHPSGGQALLRGHLEGRAGGGSHRLSVPRRRRFEFVPREPPFGAGSDPSNIVDACYPYGSIQVPGGTEPIVLHRDAVSGGGYFMIGAVISADLDLIGQLQPHAPAKFAPVTMEEALAARHERRKLLAEARASL